MYDLVTFKYCNSCTLICFLILLLYIRYYHILSFCVFVVVPWYYGYVTFIFSIILSSSERLYFLCTVFFLSISSVLPVLLYFLLCYFFASIFLYFSNFILILCYTSLLMYSCISLRLYLYMSVLLFFHT